MNFLNISVLSLFLIFNKCFCDKIQFSVCSKDGFTCQESTLTYNGEEDIIYQCQKLESHIQLWQFLGQLKVARLTIKNCATVKLDLTCNKNDTNIKILNMENIANLDIISTGHSRNPQSMIFRSININTIRSGAFTQITKNEFAPECSNDNNIADLDSLIFENSIIGTIKNRAFENLTNMKLFSWENTIVKKIEKGAFDVSCKHCSVQILSTNVEKLEERAFQIRANKLIISGTRFTTIPSQAISGSLKYFDFGSNSINVVDQGAFNLTAEHVKVEGNYLEQVHSGAFKQIRPAPFESGTTKFTYSFERNAIMYATASKLLPDVAVYNGVGASLSFTGNHIQCTCERTLSSMCKNIVPKVQTGACKTNGDDMNQFSSNFANARGVSRTFTVTLVLIVFAHFFR